MSKYLWCEDTRSGYEFWTQIMKLVNDDIKVESKGNNSNLRKAVSKINEDNNTYYILIDNVVDNPDVIREVTKIKDIEKNRKNVIVLELFSFEFVLLSFKYLEDWIFAKEDELKYKREKYLRLKNLLVSMLVEGADSSVQKQYLEILDSMNYSDLNLEQLMAKLLYEITRNTGFETTKGKLGECFYVNCCEWEKRKEDDICGLSDEHISADKKMTEIINNSVLRDVLKKAGII